MGFSAQPEYYTAWDGDNQSLTVTGFARLDLQDETRSHLDLRELVWRITRDDWQLKAGISRVFWGVTESRHLVDVINQTDAVEGLDGEDKLGQAMANLALYSDWGTLNLFWLPDFRERTFPGEEGRLRPALPVDMAQARYQSAAGRHHQDFAARWTHAFDIDALEAGLDVGVSHFQGTSRTPGYVAFVDDGGRITLAPYYDQISQTGLDLQLTTDAWLWKLEAITQDAKTADRHTEAVGGFEYTFVGVMESDADVGLISEYLFDDRGDSSPQPFDNDVMIGARVTLNDVQSTEFIVGGIVDLESHSTVLSVEGSRRIGESWKLSIEGRAYANIDAADPLYPWRREHVLSIEMARYF
ncbi:hypothetical protein MAIT1_01349 [Magnetofaba australis IT-1]|uniref:Porin n=1 Tax=Magnetofaba australis IT-1 TaxID=1434232 RepID=A0A1Y2K2J1_9PROT|nr:hypothetical protein MAIT1_01349 [Magnetofaba australis IT-1]